MTPRTTRNHQGPWIPPGFVGSTGFRRIQDPPFPLDYLPSLLASSSMIFIVLFVSWSRNRQADMKKCPINWSNQFRSHTTVSSFKSLTLYFWKVLTRTIGNYPKWFCCQKKKPHSSLSIERDRFLFFLVLAKSANVVSWYLFANGSPIILFYHLNNRVFDQGNPPIIVLHIFSNILPADYNNKPPLWSYSSISRRPSINSGMMLWTTNHTACSAYLSWWLLS